jgi:hypothetical protein
MRISCVVKVNPSVFQKSVTLSVMFAAAWNRDPCQMVPPPNVMVFDAVDRLSDPAERIDLIHRDGPTVVCPHEWI